MFGGTEYSGTVLDINWYYTVLMDGGQRRILPNSSVIISAITIISDSGMDLYTVPLPYSVPVHGLEKSYILHTFMLRLRLDVLQIMKARIAGSLASC
jgi:hypothetical protein